MKISNAKNINKVKIPTYRDLADGDVFIFLGGEQEDEIMLNTSCDYNQAYCDTCENYIFYFVSIWQVKSKISDYTCNVCYQVHTLCYQVPIANCDLTNHTKN